MNWKLFSLTILSAGLISSCASSKKERTSFLGPPAEPVDRSSSGVEVNTKGTLGNFTATPMGSTSGTTENRTPPSPSPRPAE